MNTAQSLKPKYWVFHDTQSDDIFPNTLAKSLSDSLSVVKALYKKEYLSYLEHDDSRYEFALVELELVLQ